jgi:DNA-binding protein YbaB
VGGFGGLFGGANSDGPDLDRLLSDLQDFQGATARSAQRVALETADAWSDDHLVHVWVNAQGIVVQAEFDDSVFSETTCAEAAAAVVQAAQAAAAKMRAKTDAFQAGLWQQVAQFGVQPTAGAGELEQLRPEVPLSAPGSRERRAVAEALETQRSDDRGDAGPQEWHLKIRDHD